MSASDRDGYVELLGRIATAPGRLGQEIRVRDLAATALNSKGYYWLRVASALQNWAAVRGARFAVKRSQDGRLRASRPEGLRNAARYARARARVVGGWVSKDRGARKRREAVIVLGRELTGVDASADASKPASAGPLVTGWPTGNRRRPPADNPPKVPK